MSGWGSGRGGRKGVRRLRRGACGDEDRTRRVMQSNSGLEGWEGAGGPRRQEDVEVTTARPSRLQSRLRLNRGKL